MAEVSQKTKYVKLDDGVSFSLVRTNPKLTTNTKLMYNGKKMYMESYASSELLNRSTYKNVSVKQNSLFNKDIASFLKGSGSQAYTVGQNFSNVTISDSYDNQFETLYWCGAEYINSSFYTEEIGFVAPLYLREKLPNYFLIFRLDTPSNYNLNLDENGKVLDSTFDFKSDILDKAVLIKTFDLREGSVLGNYIHNYIEQEGFEFDKSVYVNFSNSEITYYGINKIDGVLEKKVDNFKNELLRNDNPVFYNDMWFTEGFERNGLIFPYIMNIEYLFDDDAFKNNEGKESYDFARYIGVYCNNIEFGEFADFNEIIESGYTEGNVIYYFEDNNKELHRYTNTEKDGFKIDGKDSALFDETKISGFEWERVTGYGEPLDIYEGFINRAQYGFEILKPLEIGDWVGIEYDGHVECYFADNVNGDGYVGEKQDMMVGEYSDYRFSVNEDSTINDIAEALVKCVNKNKKSKFEAKQTENIVVFYAKREGKEYNGSETGGAKFLIESSLIYNRKISLPISTNLKLVNGNEYPVEDISDSDNVYPTPIYDTDNVIIGYEKSSFGDYYVDYFCGACDVEIDPINDTYKNVFKIYSDESVLFDIDRYLKTNNGDGRRIYANIMYINAEYKVEPEYRIIIVDDAPEGYFGNSEYDVSVSSTYQVEILDKFKPNHGVLSWFPVKDFDFDINYSTYAQYKAFADECKKLNKKLVYDVISKTEGVDEEGNKPNETISEKSGENDLTKLAKSPFTDDSGNNLETEYEYYFEQFHPDLCLLSKTVPYISKWGYYDEQKDSCENPYRLNVSKVFGISNLSANTYLRNCDENEYTHSMPYFMTMGTPDYSEDYQYIPVDDLYKSHSVDSLIEQYDMDGGQFQTFNDCVNYWIAVFKKTDEDMFSHFFSGKKYGKRFDRKYSRLLGGDKFHNPSTLFRGVKFEAVRQFNGVEKRSTEYNDYKFSFVYIPVMIDDIVFNNTIYFVKNDEFKFIVGMVFVNTMLGTYNHNIFDGDVNYFNKGFLYGACKDIIHPQSTKFDYDLTLEYFNGLELGGETIYKHELKNINNDFWKDYLFNESEGYKICMWKADEHIIVTKTKNFTKENIIGEFNFINEEGVGIKNIIKFNEKVNTDIVKVDGGYKISSNEYYEEYDVTIYREVNYTYFGEIFCKIDDYKLVFENNILTDICDVEWEYLDKDEYLGYIVDVSNLRFKSESIQNILINMSDPESVISIRFYNVDDVNPHVIDKTFNHGDNCDIVVDIELGSVKIISDIETTLKMNGYNGETIENLRIDITINDKVVRYGSGQVESLALKNYFSVFNQLSIYNITECINNDYNVKYYSTVEDNKYKIRVIQPDSIEIEDMYEAVPVKITQNNKSIIGSVDIRPKSNKYDIGIKVINRYSGFYNPIFNDILYFGDYSYTKNIGRLRNIETFELPYSNTNIDYNYSDIYGEFGVIKNLYYHKTNTTQSNEILSFEHPVYPAINEYALDYRDYNIFSSSWDDGYFISQDNLNDRSYCSGIGSMKDSLCMFGSKYLNLPDRIFVDTFENGTIWNDNMVIDDKDNTDIEIVYKEINNRTVKYHLFIEKRLKRYLTERLLDVFSKYINKEYSFGNKGTIEDDVEEYVEKNLLRLYKVDKVFLYIKSERMKINNKRIENEYLKYMDDKNSIKIAQGFPTIQIKDGVALKDVNQFVMKKTSEFDRDIIYNLKLGLKESFGFAVAFSRK